MTKHQKIFKQMLEEKRELFDSFQKIHDQYVLNPDSWQEQLNQAGNPVIEIIKQYENRLCGHSEKGTYARFSTTLAEKFWGLVRQKFPKIDFVGVKLTKLQQSRPDYAFNIKKISLS